MSPGWAFPVGPLEFARPARTAGAARAPLRTDLLMGGAFLADDIPARGSRLPAGLERLCILGALAFILFSGVRPPGQNGDVAIGGPIPLAPGFGAGAVYPGTDGGGLPAALPVYGSWLGSDASTGSMSTPWHTVRPPIAVYVAGYPVNAGMSLYVEQRAGASVQRRIVSPSNPGEHWARIILPLSNRADSRFRLVAIDRSAAIRGWLGFSVPCVPTRASASPLGDLARIVGCSLLCLCLVVLPGLALSRRWAMFADGSFTFLPGLSLLTLAGLAYWICPAAAHPRIVLLGLIVGVLIALLWSGRRGAVIRQIDRPARCAFVVAFAIFAIAIGRSMYAPGPVGELFGGTVSRTFWPGDRADSRISFYVSQIALEHAHAYGPLATQLFGTWSFSSRGPIAGFAAAPLVAVSGGRPPATKPQAPWSAFDAEGFEAYRIAMFGFACTAFVSFFAAVRRAAGIRAALFALGIVALAPFAIDETLFTWPKLLATSLICTAAALFMLNRRFVCGLTIGAAFLVHPSVLFSVPAFAGASFLRRRDTLDAARILVPLLAGLALVLTAWRLANGAHYTQTGFLAYVHQTADHRAGIAGWLESRFDSLMNTLVPFWLIVFHPTNRNINAVGAMSSVFVHLAFSYWCSLPFGIGLCYFPRFVGRTLHGAKRSFGWFVGIVALPFVTFTVYWGAASTGMLREGLQWWFFGLAAFVAVTAAGRPDATAITPDRPWIVARAVEICLVTFGFVALDGGKLIDPAHMELDIAGLLIMLSATGLLSANVWFALTRAAQPALTDPAEPA